MTGGEEGQTEWRRQVRREIRLRPEDTEIRCFEQGWGSLPYHAGSHEELCVVQLLANVSIGEGHASSYQVSVASQVFCTDEYMC